MTLRFPWVQRCRQAWRPSDELARTPATRTNQVNQNRPRCWGENASEAVTLPPSPPPPGTCSMSYKLAPTPRRLIIWQQNLNKSKKAQFDLINSPIHKDWDVMLLQEPYIDKYGNTKATSKWHMVYPTDHLTDLATNRAVMLVNTALDSNAWMQVPFAGSNN